MASAATINFSNGWERHITSIMPDVRHEDYFRIVRDPGAIQEGGLHSQRKGDPIPCEGSYRGERSRSTSVIVTEAVGDAAGLDACV